jgi:hypothetical protein
MLRMEYPIELSGVAQFPHGDDPQPELEITHVTQHEPWLGHSLSACESLLILCGTNG